MKKKKKKSAKNSFIKSIHDGYIKFKKSILEEESYSKSTFTLFEVLILILISILFGIVIGYIITYTRNPIGNKKLNEVVHTYNDIIDNYYEDVDKEGLADAAIKGMVEYLGDPYSNYMNSTVSEDFNETVEGTFVGLGITVSFSEHYNKIIDVQENTPADKAGLKKDDLLLKVGDKDLTDVYGEDLIKLVRGKVGDKKKFKIKRGEEEKEITVVLDVVEIISASGKTYDYEGKKIGYIRVSAVATNTYLQFKKALEKLEKEKIDSLIIDVRGNPGGHLLQTKQILSLFYPKKTVLYQIASKKKKKKVYDNSSELREYPVAVIIDKGSASAAEIIASCFKEKYGKAIIVGVNSYGKGTVQQSQNLTSGSSIKYTTEKWLTSKGKWLNKKGVSPDFKVELGEKYASNPSDENDSQLQEALKQLKESN